MNTRIRILIAISILLWGICSITAQHKARQGKICSDPTIKCKSAEGFQPFDLPFETGKSFVIIESERFYGIVLRSKKMSDWGDCANPVYGEKERLQIQELFPHNKVFALNCVETGTNYYSGVADQVAFIGVFAGRTLAEANAFLKTVQATSKFPGVRVRRMQISINGT